MKSDYRLIYLVLTRVLQALDEDKELDIDELAAVIWSEWKFLNGEQ